MFYSFHCICLILLLLYLIPAYFILFDVIASEIIFLISFLGCSLLISINAAGLNMYIFEKLQGALMPVFSQALCSQAFPNFPVVFGARKQLKSQLIHFPVFDLGYFFRIEIGNTLLIITELLLGLNMCVIWNLVPLNKC